MNRYTRQAEALTTRAKAPTSKGPGRRHGTKSFVAAGVALAVSLITQGPASAATNHAASPPRQVRSQYGPLPRRTLPGHSTY